MADRPHFGGDQPGMAPGSLPEPAEGYAYGTTADHPNCRCEPAILTGEELRERYRRLLEQSGYDPDYVMPVFPDATTENSEWWQRHGHDHAPNLLWRIVLAMSALYFLIRWVATGERPTP